ncbi:hypothetical protein KAR91_51020 [Candidatus Pacearchaeota archaeon]|nr:hypothetical protein [Candidatus Pacearchaeota archaeon]
MSRPTLPEKIGWIASAKIIDPGSSKKSSGWDPGERPPNQSFNWFWELLTRIWNFCFGTVTKYNVIIDSDSDRGNYASVASYIADSPAAGDRVLIKVDEVLAATLSIPAGVEISQEKGIKFTLTANFSPIIEFAANSKSKNIRVENSNTGTIAKGVSINGDDTYHDNLVVENKSTGTITGSVYIEAGTEGNYAQCRSINSGGGTITNDLTDNSGNAENYVIVQGDSGISYSTGAIGNQSIRNSYRNLSIKNGSTPDEQLDILADELILQNSDGIPRRLTGVSFTVDNTVSGQNGLFTGSVAVNTWYFVWITSGSSGNTSGLHLSSTLATVLGDAPAGYNEFGALVGAILTDGTSDFIVIEQVDNRVSMSNIAIVSSDGSATWTLKDISAFIPITAKAIFGTLQNNPTGAPAGTDNRVHIASGSNGEGNLWVAENQGNIAHAPYHIPIITPQTIWFGKTDNGETTIGLSGWEY